MNLIVLANGKGFAKVDDGDFEELSKYFWQVNPAGRNFYAVRASRTEDGRLTTISMHKHIMKPGKGEQVDHINGDGLDCQRDNMRICLKRQNSMNRTRTSLHSSKYKGVSFFDGAWKASIRVSNKKIHLGTFYDEEKAAEAYNTAAKHYFGEFAAPGVVEVGY